MGKHKFKAGDLVQLKIKAPQLTVGEIYRVESVFCDHITVYLSDVSRRIPHIIYDAHKFERVEINPIEVDQAEQELEEILSQQEAYADICKGGLK